MLQGGQCGGDDRRIQMVDAFKWLRHSDVRGNQGDKGIRSDQTQRDQVPALGHIYTCPASSRNRAAQATTQYPLDLLQRYFLIGTAMDTAIMTQTSDAQEDV
ncbi:hypothetical protein E4U50_003905 [Claviceps purpurea]|nr:hypothetical protein E4U50_003905 [Claviceps purpurea]